MCIRDSWNTDSEYQQIKITSLLKDVQKFLNFINKDFNFEIEYPFNKIYQWLEDNSCEECIEYIVSIMMEPYNNIVNPLVKEMSSDEEKYFNIPTYRKVEELRNIVEAKYPNILDINFEEKENNKNFGLFQKIKKNLD